MAKISIDPNPTFTAQVPIPVHGGDPVMVGFTFKHRTLDEMAEWVGNRGGKADVDAVLDMVDGWEFAEEFTPEAVASLLQKRIGASLSIFTVYTREIYQAKLKN